jgi:hypothetical protein
LHLPLLLPLTLYDLAFSGALVLAGKGETLLLKRRDGAHACRLRRHVSPFPAKNAGKGEIG